jgi:hypothetical protein
LETSIPEGWSVAFGPESDSLAFQRLSFSDWALDDAFFERLADGDERALDSYRRQTRAQGA